MFFFDQSASGGLIGGLIDRLGEKVADGLIVGRGSTTTTSSLEVTSIASVFAISGWKKWEPTKLPTPMNLAQDAASSRLENPPLAFR